VFNTIGSGLQQAWARVLKRVEINNLHFHDLRHEAIIRFIKEGLSLPEVALTSGQKNQLRGFGIRI
jgi:integrase